MNLETLNQLRKFKTSSSPVHIDLLLVRYFNFNFSKVLFRYPTYFFSYTFYNLSLENNKIYLNTLKDIVYLFFLRGRAFIRYIYTIESVACNGSFCDL